MNYALLCKLPRTLTRLVLKLEEPGLRVRITDKRTIVARNKITEFFFLTLRQERKRKITEHQCCQIGHQSVKHHNKRLRQQPFPRGCSIQIGNISHTDLSCLPKIVCPQVQMPYLKVQLHTSETTENSTHQLLCILSAFFTNFLDSWFPNLYQCLVTNWVCTRNQGPDLLLLSANNSQTMNSPIFSTFFPRFS